MTELLILVAFAGAPIAMRVWASRRYARRTGRSVWAGVAWHWFQEPLLGVPVGVWATLWVVAGVTAFLWLLSKLGG